MIRAEMEAKDRKRRQKEEEERMEGEFRRMMMEKFAKEDKLEQLAQQKRRMKELEHKKEIERMWLERLNAYRLQKEREQEEFNRAMGNKKWEEEQIQREKEKLLKQHLPNLEGFMPKQLAKMSNTFNSQGKTNYGSKFNLG